jgi:hypothetical protein
MADETRVAGDSRLRLLVDLTARGEATAAVRLLDEAPELARTQFQVGATRQAAEDYVVEPIKHYVYAGDTALHIAAAAYQLRVARELTRRGADVAARNRRGAQPLHYACDGQPGSAFWNPAAQRDLVEFLIAAGADPNAWDKSGTGPLHRAVRNRCAAAVRALLAGGADPHRANSRGTSPLQLAIQTTGRGGSGSLEAKSQQAEIIELLS